MSEEQIKERKERDEKIKKTEKAVLELLVGLSYGSATLVLEFARRDLRELQGRAIVGPF